MPIGMKAARLRQTHQDSRGRTWSVVVVPVAQADSEDATFWRTLTPEQRIVAVHGCLEKRAEGAQGALPDRRGARPRSPRAATRHEGP